MVNADYREVARVLVSEPHPDVKALLELVLRRLGHVTVADADDRPDVLVMEPAWPDAVETARRLPTLPLVCASILPPSAETLALCPDAYLVKPVRMRDLEAALAQAFAATMRQAPVAPSATGLPA
jgi:hypothetical protein